MCLPVTEATSTEDFLGIRCIATGWGQVEPGGDLQSRLHEVELTVVDNGHCKTM